METLNLLYPIITGSLIVPIVTWIKSKLPEDFPLQSVVIASALNLLAIWGLSEVLSLNLTLEQIIAYGLGGQVTSQIVHAGKKTKNKLLIGDK